MPFQYRFIIILSLSLSRSISDGRVRGALIKLIFVIKIHFNDSNSISQNISIFIRQLLPSRHGRMETIIVSNDRRIIIIQNDNLSTGNFAVSLPSFDHLIENLFVADARNACSTFIVNFVAEWRDSLLFISIVVLASISIHSCHSCCSLFIRTNTSFVHMECIYMAK